MKNNPWLCAKEGVGYESKKLKNFQEEWQKNIAEKEED